MKKTINIITILFISIFLISCGNQIPTDKNQSSPYIVTSITNLEYGTCTYKINTGTDYIRFYDILSVVDSVGKFNICDTVYFTLNKR